MGTAPSFFIITAVEEVIRAPQDPYTRELLASIPRLHGGERPTFVTGAPPDPVDPPRGCRFADRCPHAFERCSEDPPLFEPSSGHLGRCWLLEPRRGSGGGETA